MRIFIPGSIKMMFNSTRQYALTSIPLLHVIPEIHSTAALPSGRYDPCIREHGIKQKHAEPFIIDDATVEVDG